MGRRYSLIRKGEELAKAQKALRDWEDLTATEKSTKYQAKVAATGNLKSAVASSIGYLMPFGVDPSKKNVAQCRIIVSGTAEANKTESAAGLIAKLQTVLVGRYALSVLTAGTWYVHKEKASSLARVTLTQTGSTVDSDEAKTSRITGRKYTYRKRNSVSQVFGQSFDFTGIQSYETAKASITTALAVDSDTKIYFRPQGNIKSGVVEQG